MHTRTLSVLLATVIAWSGAAFTTGAHAAEALVIHVATGAAGAHDGAAGTAEAPLKTLGAAVRRAEAATGSNRPVVVRVHPGTYRESVAIGASSTSAPLTVEAAGPGVTVSGADLWSGWTPGANGTWISSWPMSWGLAPLPSGWPAVEPLLRRRELVVVNGTLLRQVSTAAEVAEQEGTYLVDEANDRLVVQPAGTGDLRAATVEVAVRKTGLTTNGRHHLTVRGIAFRHVATDFQRGAVVINGARDLTIEDSRFEWNSYGGLNLFHVLGAALRRNAINDNGVVGLSAWKTKDLLLQENETSRNNTTRGLWANHDGWEDSSKLLSSHGVTVSRHVAVGNRGPGLWFDTDVSDLLVEDSLFARNSRHGVFLEVSQGPSVFRGNRMCDNGQIGFLNVKSTDVTLTGNEIFGNGQEALAFSGPSGAFTIRDWETGRAIALRNERFVLTDNVLSQGPVRLVQNNLQQDDWAHLTSSITSDRNLWHSTHAAPFTVPGKWLSFQGWRTSTTQDAGSAFGPAPVLSCTRPDAGATTGVEPVAATSPLPAASPSPTPTATKLPGKKFKTLTRLSTRGGADRRVNRLVNIQERVLAPSS